MTTALQVHTPTPSGAIAPLNKDALKAQLARLEDPEMLELQQRLAAAYDKACASLIGAGDVQKEGNREFKKKSAWRKLGRHFGISTHIVREELIQLEDGEFIAKCIVHGAAPWGVECDAAGACGSDEESGRRTITMADAIATAQTRAVNRAISDLVAMGEVSAEELSERSARENGKRKSSRPELTLEEALELPYPWKSPPKYAGKPLSEVSTRALLVCSKWAKQKIDSGEGTRAIEQLRQACILITEERPDLEETIAKMQAAEKKDDATTAAATSVDADGAPVAPAAAAPAAEPAPAAADPSPAPAAPLDEEQAANDAGPLVPELEEEPTPEPTIKQLSQKLIALLDDPTLAEDVRVKYLDRAAAGKLKEPADYKRAIAELELVLQIGA